MSEKKRISELRHPSRARKMTVMHCLCPLRFGGDIDTENIGGSLVPVGAFRVRVEQAQVIREMTFVIGGELRQLRRLI